MTGLAGFLAGFATALLSQTLVILGSVIAISFHVRTLKPTSLLPEEIRNGSRNKPEGEGTDDDELLK